MWKLEMAEFWEVTCIAFPYLYENMTMLTLCLLFYKLDNKILRWIFWTWKHTNKLEFIQNYWRKMKIRKMKIRKLPSSLAFLGCIHGLWKHVNECEYIQISFRNRNTKTSQGHRAGCWYLHFFWKTLESFLRKICHIFQITGLYILVDILPSSA